MTSDIAADLVVGLDHKAFCVADEYFVAGNAGIDVGAGDVGVVVVDAEGGLLRTQK